jgi:hypothetical protein
MCLGCPNHASYKAIVSGEFPAALCFKCSAWLVLGPKHPWGSRRNTRNTALAYFSIYHPFEDLELPLIAYNKRPTETLMHFDQPGIESARDTDLVEARLELYLQLKSKPF